MRICGITFDHTANYGSCLQAFALQHSIEKQCIGDEDCNYQLIPVKKFKDWPKANIWKNILISPLLALHRKQFLSFEKKYMHYAPVSSFGELPELNETTDAFVCGSDVIWNPYFNMKQSAFYLDFAEKYRFSYAASFGKKEISEETIDFITPLLNRLDLISVRDETSRAIALQCTDKPVAIVADPVLLMNSAEWELVMEPVHNKEKYIFVYVTHLNQTIREFLKKLQKESGCKTIYSAAGPKQALKLRMLNVQKPGQWLRLIKDAEYVVTNSFHATLFSILFHRKFFTVVEGEKNKGINVRMNDFLIRAGLESRIYSDIPEKIDLSEIDYSFADEEINQLREESLVFLRKNLEAAYMEKEITLFEGRKKNYEDVSKNKKIFT